MNLFTMPEVTANYVKAGVKKLELPVYKMLLLGFLSGVLIAMSSTVSSTAAHSIESVGVIRLVTGLVFAFGLGMVIITSAELFTGNCLLFIPALEKEIKWRGVFRNWIFVYLANFAGAAAVAACCALFGQLNYSNDGLAVYTIRLAAAKCSIAPGSAVVFGFWCNFLVCLGVFLANAAQDIPGKVIGAYMPVAYFVTNGFEHSVANMYYGPAGIFAAGVPRYLEKAAAAGVDTSPVTWGGFIVKNLIPVSLGNILGGFCFSFIIWACFLHDFKGTKKS
ncbi:MAG: formate/nitrite transporter family protein [Treponema sp.]|jgi:formate/nitrite transporter|nr:formate/nitrite transporter family protein [Treponema sp.]